MFFNAHLREINLKIVYYGPALSGKTTNLEQLYRRIPVRARSEMVSVKTREDRTIFFDFMELSLGKIKGLTPRFKLYTVPGQVYYAATRKLVLRGVDGIVFVADSQAGRLEDNVASMQDLWENLQEMGYDPYGVPLVLQFNKRDLPDALPVSQLKKALNHRACPTFEAIAIQGVGVSETLKGIISAVMQSVYERLRVVPTPTR